MTEGLLLDVAQKGLALIYWQGVKDGACWAAIAACVLFLLLHRGESK